MFAPGSRASSATITPAPRATFRSSPCHPEWEAIFAENLVGPPEDRQLAIPPSRLGDFMQRFRAVFEGPAGDGAVLLCSGPIRSHVRAIVERLRPATPVLSQAEIFPRARIRTVGTI